MKNKIKVEDLRLGDMVDVVVSTKYQNVVGKVIFIDNKVNEILVRFENKDIGWVSRRNVPINEFDPSCSYWWVSECLIIGVARSSTAYNDLRSNK